MAKFTTSTLVKVIQEVTAFLILTNYNPVNNNISVSLRIDL